MSKPKTPPYVKVYLHLLDGEHDPVRLLGIFLLCLEEDRLGHPRPKPISYRQLAREIGWSKRTLLRFIRRHQDCYPRLVAGLPHSRPTRAPVVPHSTKVEPGQSEGSAPVVPQPRPSGAPAPTDNTATTVDTERPQPTNLPAYQEDPPISPPGGGPRMDDELVELVGRADDAMLVEAMMGKCSKSAALALKANASYCGSHRFRWIDKRLKLLAKAELQERQDD